MVKKSSQRWAAAAHKAMGELLNTYACLGTYITDAATAQLQNVEAPALSKDVVQGLLINNSSQSYKLTSGYVSPEVEAQANKKVSQALSKAEQKMLKDFPCDAVAKSWDAVSICSYLAGEERPLLLAARGRDHREPGDKYVSYADILAFRVPTYGFVLPFRKSKSKRHLVNAVFDLLNAYAVFSFSPEDAGGGFAPACHEIDEKWISPAQIVALDDVIEDGAASVMVAPDKNTENNPKK